MTIVRDLPSPHDAKLAADALTAPGLSFNAQNGSNANYWAIVKTILRAYQAGDLVEHKTIISSMTPEDEQQRAQNAVRALFNHEQPEGTVKFEDCVGLIMQERAAAYEQGRNDQLRDDMDTMNQQTVLNIANRDAVRGELMSLIDRLASVVTCFK